MTYEPGQRSSIPSLAKVRSSKRARGDQEAWLRAPRDEAAAGKSRRHGRHRLAPNDCGHLFKCSGDMLCPAQ